MATPEPKPIELFTERLRLWTRIIGTCRLSRIMRGPIRHGSSGMAAGIIPALD